MSSIEHYFENLLFHGFDDVNWAKKFLTYNERKTIEICADYVIYSIFGNREKFLNYLNEKDEKIVDK